jgi:hypothetical protein
MGYPGIRLEPNGDLSFTARCPEGVDGIKIRGINYLGNSFDTGYTCSADSKRGTQISFTLQSDAKASASTKELFVRGASLHAARYQEQSQSVTVTVAANEKVIISAKK